MACCWKPKKRQSSQTKENQEERQASQFNRKWEQRQSSQYKDLTFLLDCMIDDKEDEALHMIASMSVRSLCLDVNVKRYVYTRYLGPPFYHAMKLRRPRIVSALLKKGVDWDVLRYTQEYKDLFKCIENNKQNKALKLVVALVVTGDKMCMDYEVYGTTLINAVQHGMMRVVRALLKKLVDPYERELSEIDVLFECLKRNMQDEVLDLIASMDVTALHHIPHKWNGVYVKTLMNAAQYGRNKVVRALLEKRVEWDEPLSREIKAVLECIQSNRLEEALDLIASVDVTTLNLQADYGVDVYVTAIMYALQQGRERVVKALLVKGAELDKYHTFETKALFECLKRNMHKEALDLIASMDVENLNRIADYKDGNNLTALMYAVLLDEMIIVKALLEKGVDVNIGQVEYQKSGFCEETPLYCAIKNGNTDLMDMLLEHGADPLYNQTKTRYYQNFHGTKEMVVVSPHVSFILAFCKAGLSFYRIIRYTNMYKEFVDFHQSGTKLATTCLCFAVPYGFGGRPNHKNPIHQIIQRGGVVCLGNPDYTAMEVGYPGAKGICGMVFNALKNKLNIRIDDRRNFDFHTCHKDARHLLTLLCATDYVHENSCLYKTTETYTDTAKANNIPVDLDGLDDLDRKIWEQALEERRQILTWMTDITKQPSTLKHICRVYIRRSISRLCIEAVETLLLPIELIEYVSVVNRFNRCEFCELSNPVL